MASSSSAFLDPLCTLKGRIKAETDVLDRVGIEEQEAASIEALSDGLRKASLRSNWLRKESMD